MPECSHPPLAHKDESITTLEIPRVCGHGPALVYLCAEHGKIPDIRAEQLVDVCPTCLHQATQKATAARAAAEHQGAKDARAAAQDGPQ